MTLRPPPKDQLDRRRVENIEIADEARDRPIDGTL